MALPAGLGPMAQYKQWLNFVLVPGKGGHTDKLPVNPATGDVCDAHNPALWVDYDTAAASGMPVAFVFTDSDPFFFLDIDECLGADGKWTETALGLCGMFAGAAVEISQSGRGMHIFGRAPDEVAHGCDSKPLGSQFYTSRRFVALTCDSVIGSCDFTPAAAVYGGFISQYFPPKVAAPPGAAGSEWTTEPAEDWDGPDDNAELVRRMLKSKSVKAVMGGVTVGQLWEADDVALAKAYPDDGGHKGREWDWSQADAALCQHLAFWTGRNCARMDEMWGLSALGQRDKYTDRPEYRQRTVLRACGACRSSYRQRKPTVAAVPGAEVAVAVPVGQVSGFREGFQYLDPTGQIALFKGCVYIRDIHRVFVPDGGLLKSDQFKATYGGYAFAIDTINDKTTRNAWEAFTESQAYHAPRALSTCFRPELEPAAIVDVDGSAMLNTYVPMETTRQAGDSGPFLDFLARILPVETDRAIMVAYMAAVVQYPGVKFQWSPLLQGTQGNGKSFIGSCLAHAVGEKYTHLPDSKDLGNVFNSWLCGNLLIIVEEVLTREKVDTIESLKWMITNSRVPVQAKGRDQVTGDNRANFIMFTNHRDAVTKTKDDRRFAVFYTAQQDVGDLARCGMGGDYFPNLYAWARGGGFAIVNDFLRRYEIPAALNPAGACHRAPDTSSTGDAITESRGFVEQRIVEACDEGRPGFSGGWISSMALDRLISETRVKVPNNRRALILRELGYVRHPGLYAGRTSQVVPVEGGKPVLYVREGHISGNRSGRREIMGAYCEAQGYVVAGMPGAVSAG